MKDTYQLSLWYMRLGCNWHIHWQGPSSGTQHTQIQYSALQALRRAASQCMCHFESAVSGQAVLFTGMAQYMAAAQQSTGSCPTCATPRTAAPTACRKPPCQLLSWRTSPPATRSPSPHSCGFLCGRHAFPQTLQCLKSEVQCIPRARSTFASAQNNLLVLQGGLPLCHLCSISWCHCPGQADRQHWKLAATEYRVMMIAHPSALL